MQSRGDGLSHTGQWRSQLVVADVNGDGRQDLLLPPARKGSGKPQIYLGQADGSWANWKDVGMPPKRFDYGGVASLDFDGDGRLDMVYGMHLKGMAAIAQASAGQFQDASTGLNSFADGKPSVAGSQSVLALPKPATIGGAQLLVTYEGMQSGGVGASIWCFQNGAWQRRDIPGAPPGSHAALGDKDRPFYLGGKGVMAVDANWDAPAVRLAGSVPDGVFSHALAVVSDAQRKTSNAYVSTSRFMNEAWSRRVERISIPSAAGAPVMSADAQVAERSGQTYFSALAATRATPWQLGGDIVAAGDINGIIELYLVDAAGRAIKLLELPADEWRRGCQVSNLVWTQLKPGESPRLAAMFSGEASVYDIGRGCTNGGGLDVFELSAAPQAGAAK